MIKIFRLLIVTLILNFGGQGLLAQVQFYTTFNIYPDSAAINSSDSALIVIKNLGNTPYQGPIYFYFTTDTVTYIPFGSDSIIGDTLNPWFTTSDSAVVKHTISFLTPDFQLGDNIVVVWSSGNLVIPPNDTVRDAIYLKPSSPNVQESSWENILFYHPQQTEWLIMENLPLKNDLKLVIYNTQGQIIRMYSVPNAVSAIRFGTGNLPNGIYHAELSDGIKRKALSFAVSR